MAPKRTKQEKKDLIILTMHTTGAIYDKRAIESMQRQIGINTGKDPLEIIKELIYEGLIETEKISNVNLYWSFPYQNYKILKNGIEKQEAMNQKLSEDIIFLEDSIKQSLMDKDPTEERKELENELKDLIQQVQLVEKDLKKYQKNDPKNLEQIELQQKVFQDKKNVWIENHYTLLTYLKKERFLSKPSDILPIFGLEDDQQDDLYPES